MDDEKTEVEDFLDDWTAAEDADKDADKDADDTGDDANEDADDDADKDADSDNSADDENQSDDDADDDDDAEGEQDDKSGDEPDDAKDDKDRVPTTSEFRGMLDEREKRQKFEAENEDLKRRLAQHEKEQENETPTPDPITDPEEFRNHQKNELQALEQRTNMNAQEYTARTKHGDKAIDDAIDAMAEHMKSNPETYQQVMSDRFPYEALVKWHADKSFFAEVEAAGGKEAWLKAQAEASDDDADKGDDKNADADSDDDSEDDAEAAAKEKKLVPSLSGKGAKSKRGKAKAKTAEENFDEMFPR